MFLNFHHHPFPEPMCSCAMIIITFTKNYVRLEKVRLGSSKSLDHDTSHGLKSTLIPMDASVKTETRKCHVWWVFTTYRSDGAASKLTPPNDDKSFHVWWGQVSLRAYPKPHDNNRCRISVIMHHCPYGILHFSYSYVIWYWSSATPIRHKHQY